MPQIHYNPTAVDYQDGFEKVNAAIVRAGGVFEGIDEFRKKYASSNGMDGNLFQAAFQLINLEPLNSRDRSPIDLDRKITRVAFNGYLLGLMVNERIYPDFEARVRLDATSYSIIEDEDLRSDMKARIEEAGGLTTQTGAVWSTYGLSRDGLGRLNEATLDIASGWATEVHNRVGLDNQASLSELNEAAYEIAFGTGLGYSLNKAYWRFSSQLKPLIIVTPVWEHEAAN